MKFTDEVLRRIAAVINERTRNRDTLCPVCDTNEWTIADGFVYFPVQDNINVMRVGGRGMPCLAMTCSACGNTQFLNMLTLGLGDLLLPEKDDKAETKERPSKEASIKQ